jgi:hypothetical protein
MGKIRKVNALASLLVLLFGINSNAKFEDADGIGLPRGIMVLSANGFWSSQPIESWPVKPEILINESFAWNKLKHIDGAISMLTVSTYLLARYDIPFGRSRMSAFLSAGPGVHVLSSLSSPGSPGLSTPNTDIAFKGHVITGLKYAITDRQFISLSIRSTFPADSPVDCGYLSYGRNLSANKGDGLFHESRWMGITRFGINSTKDDYSAFSASGIIGRRLGSHIYMGLGMGWDCAENILVAPLFLDIRAYFRESSRSPYFVLDGGYSIGWIQGQDSYSSNGFAGFMGLGYSIPYARDNAINIELGAKTERTATPPEHHYYYGNGNDSGPLPIYYTHHYNFESEFHFMASAQLGFQFGL